MNVMNNPMIKKILAKAPENIKGEMEKILKNNTISLSQKVTKLNDLISDSPHYEKAKKMQGFFIKKFFKKESVPPSDKSDKK